jgi:Lrp/AsnC family transcriptional regulator
MTGIEAIIAIRRDYPDALILVMATEPSDGHNLQKFSQAIRAFPEVMECHVVLRAYDFLLRVIAADMDAYQQFFFEKLSQLPDIREVNSFVAITEIKSTTALPMGR